MILQTAILDPSKCMSPTRSSTTTTMRKNDVRTEIRCFSPGLLLGRSRKTKARGYESNRVERHRSWSSGKETASEKAPKNESNIGDARWMERGRKEEEGVCCALCHQQEK